MKKYFFSLIISFLSTFSYSQVTNKGEPLSWSQSNLKSAINTVQMKSFDLELIRAEDAINDLDRSKPWRFGYEFKVNLGLDNSGAWNELSNGDRIWRINIASSGAKSLNFIFDKYKIPEGATVYLYNNDRTDLLGAYTHVMNNDDEMLGTWIVEGDNVWIEYHEPKDVVGKGILNIGKVIHGYRNTTDFEVLSKTLNDSGNCNHDVDCSIGSDFDPLKERLKHSIAFIIMQGFVCSGQLINNTNNDKAPYFLTANHCDAGATSTWSFRFNWISPNPVCATTQNSTDATVNQTTSGATNLVNNSNSDVRLLRLTGGLNPNWDLEWAGWDRTDNTPNYTVGIHHPEGDIMKVCRDNDSPFQTSTNFNGDSTTQVWVISGVGFAGGNGWDIGVTEGGSSGSAIFNESGHIVGQLAGGQAACSGTNDNNSWDIYGRFAVSWNDNNLGQWLDPTNTGVTTLDMSSGSLVIEPQPQSFSDLINVFPNPTTGEVEITNESEATVTYVINSLIGQKVKEGSISSNFNNQLDLSSFRDGIYIITLSQGSSVLRKKVIVARR